MNGWLDSFNRLAANPPMWVRAFALVLPVVAALGLAAKRGVAIGVVAGLVYALIALPMAVSPQAVAGWSRRHPALDGAILGPLVFLAIAYITPWPLWVCVGIGLVGVLLGAARGNQRRRYQGRTGS